MEIKKELVLKSEYEEVEKVENLLNELQDELGFGDDFFARLMLTVTEAAANGIVHGNKLDPRKIVTITAESDGDVLKFSSKDEGEGFKPSEIPNPLAEENLLKPSGRGVFLMKEYADEVEYSENGTRITISFNLPD